MGLLALLGAIPSLSLVKIDKSVTVNVTGKDNNVAINGKKITDPKEKAKILEAINAENYLGIAHDSYPHNIIHEDLQDSFSTIKEAAVGSKDLNFLDKYTNKKYMKAIFMARAGHKAMLSNNNKYKRGLISKLILQLDKKFPKDGKKMLNLMTAKYFDSLIIPTLIELEKFPNTDKNFNKYLESLLHFFPTAVFVNNDTNNRIIFREISKRLGIENIPYIIVHALGDENIKKVDDAIPILQQEYQIIISHEYFCSDMGIKGRNTKIEEISTD